MITNSQFGTSCEWSVENSNEAEDDPLPIGPKLLAKTSFSEIGNVMPYYLHIKAIRSPYPDPDSGSGLLPEFNRDVLVQGCICLLRSHQINKYLG